ncbi:MAG: phosphoribosylglycinamide formyltransferase [Reichenbachiella sp.]
MGKKKIAILASGSGTNAEQIVKHFAGHDEVEVSLILSNKKNAFVLERAKNLGVASGVFDRSQFYESEKVLDDLKKLGIEYIVLAGFLWLVPLYLIKGYSGKIINIHPALLPKYGGKGMYGSKVHEAVVANQEKESGITIHLVDEIYDNGEVLCQEKIEVTEEDTADAVAAKIHLKEYEYFPKTIEEWILNLIER